MHRLKPELRTALVAGGLVLVALALYAFWTRPAARDLEVTIGGAEVQARRVADEAPERAADAYLQALGRLEAASRDRVDVLDDILQAQREALYEWLPGVRVNPASEDPYADSFRDRFAFAQDELRRAALGAAAPHGFAPGREVPLHAPRFLEEERDPGSVAEMREAQLLFNLEELLLRAAAAAGGLPYAAAEFRAPTDDERGRFVTRRVILKLEVADPALPDLLRAVRAPGPRGPIVTVEGLATRPAPLEAGLGREAPPRIRVDLVLGVRVPRPTGEVS